MYKVAIVDDQQSNRLVFGKMLTDHYQVSMFESAEDIFEAYKTGEVWDIILSDLHMAGKTGKDVILFFSDKTIPVMIITADSERRVESELLSCGATDFVTKPVHPEVLLNRIAIQIRLREQSARISATQEQLIQSEKLAALGQLAAGVAHEINNPVGFVSSNMNLISRYISKLNDELDHFKGMCEQEESGASILLYASWSAQSKLTDHLSSLTELASESLEGLARVRDIVKDLKEYSHTGDARFELADINSMLKSSVNLLRNEIKYKAEVKWQLTDIPKVDCITSQLGQVFVNIIVNACQAIEEFGVITITTKAKANEIEITISDNGCGMSMKTIKKVFDPFFTTKPVGKGTGIGLAITRSIIDRHSGSIQVASEVGKGTTFSIRIPQEQTQAQDTDVKDSAENHP
jgi:signal transduction histidine kinase